MALKDIHELRARNKLAPQLFGNPLQASVDKNNFNESDETKRGDLCEESLINDDELIFHHNKMRNLT